MVVRSGGTSRALVGSRRGDVAVAVLRLVPARAILAAGLLDLVLVHAGTAVLALDLSFLVLVLALRANLACGLRTPVRVPPARAVVALRLAVLVLVLARVAVLAVFLLRAVLVPAPRALDAV